jgi:hypothetical protein
MLLLLLQSGAHIGCTAMFRILERSSLCISHLISTVTPKMQHILTEGMTKVAQLLQISEKSGKDSTSTLSLVIHRVRFKKNLQKHTY